MKKHIKKAAISELPVLLKGIAIIIFTLLSYFAGIVFADYAAGRELNYFENINNYVEEKLAEVKPTPVSTHSPVATAIPNGPTHTLTSDDFYMEITPYKKGDYEFYKAELKNEETQIATFSTSDKEYINKFTYIDEMDTIFYVMSLNYDDIRLFKLVKEENISSSTNSNPRRITTLYMQEQGMHSLTGIDILDYSSSQDKLLLTTGAGDGCGGGGYIWTLNESSRETLLDYKRGCAAEDQDKVYVAYFNGELIYYIEEDKWDDANLGNLMAYNAFTQTERILLPNNFYPAGTSSIFQSYENENILIFNNQDYTEKYEYNLETRQFIETQ